MLMKLVSLPASLSLSLPGWHTLNGADGLESHGFDGEADAILWWMLDATQAFQVEGKDSIIEIVGQQSRGETVNDTVAAICVHCIRHQ
jgi:hypothetical protein